MTAVLINTALGDQYLLYCTTRTKHPPASLNYIERYYYHLHNPTDNTGLPIFTILPRSL